MNAPVIDPAGRAVLGLAVAGLVSVCGGLYAAEQQAKKHEEMIVPGINITMVKIPKGSFMMGHAADFVGSSGDEKPEHKVAFAQDFWMGATTVTVGQFRHFVEVTGYITEAELDHRGIFTNKAQPRKKGLSWRDPGIPNYVQTDNHPVLGISWDDAMQFCAWLTEREQSAGRLPAGYVFRLPTGAQWEYCARGNSLADPGYWKDIIETEEKLSADDRARMVETYRRKGVNLAPARERAAQAGYREGEPGPEEFSVFLANSGGVPNPVGTKKPNGFGLYDMIGNGWSWVYDWYGRYPAGDQVDPQGPRSANSPEIILPHREMRGATWNSTGAHGLMSTNRWDFHGNTSNQWAGFRIALTTVPPPAPEAPGGAAASKGAPGKQ